jgi:cytochrome c peroxidase
MDNVAPTVNRPEIDRARPNVRVIRRLILVVFLTLILAVAAIAFWPVPADYRGDEATAGAGLGHGGLQRPFPAMIVRPDNGLENAGFNQRAKLGRLLYFDPILSHANDLSCATCHHPDLGFTDGRGQSMGKGGHGIGPERSGGEVLRRGSPTIWNAAYNFKQFWDGRAKDLEEQATGPITSENEMGSNPDELVRKLRAIPEYARLFDGAFGGNDGSSISIDSVTEAVASFERTLTSNNSPFDRFAAGDTDALTSGQRRGFNLFRSGKTRCFECHGLPTFSNPDFKVVGVPDLEGQQPDSDALRLPAVLDTIAPLRFLRSATWL